MTAVIPGTGRTVNRPLRAGPSPDIAGAGSNRPEDALLEEARLLSSVAESLASSIGRPEAALWKRPAPSKAYRWITTAIPWMKPASLVELSTISGHAQSARRAHQAYGAPARGRGEIAGTAKKLLGRLGQRREALDRAVANFEHARSAHADSRSVSATSDQTSDAARRRSQAATELRAASSALQEAISGSDLVGLMGLSYLADQREKSDAFARKRINELQAKAHALRSDAYDRRDTIDLELRARTEEARVLMSIGHDLDAAEKTALEAQGRLRHQEKRLGRLPAGPADSGSMSPALPALHARLSNEIAQAQALLQSAETAQMRTLQSLDVIDAGFARVNRQIAELMQQRSAAEAQRDEAERSLAWLAEASSRLAKQTAVTAEPEADVDTQAIDELHDRFVAQQFHLPHAFGTRPDAGLQTVLEALSAHLKETGAPGRLPLMMAMETITNALVDVTRSDAGRATRLLNALGCEFTAHWAELAQAQAETRSSRATAAAPADHTVSDVLAFNRLIAALPRGSDLLHALSRDGRQPAAKEQMQALHVFWTADDASRTEPDRSVVAWLGRARRVALAGCRGETDAGFDDVDHAAYHAVRNGYLSNAPGSLYAEHNARMMKAITEWVIRAASSSSRTNDAAQPTIWRRLASTLNIRRPVARAEPTNGHSPQRGAAAGMSEADAARQAMFDYLEVLEKRHGRASKVKPTSQDAQPTSATRATRPTNGAARPAAWRHLVPTWNKTPFNRRLLSRGYDVAESMGLDSARLLVDRAVRQRMSSLAPLIEAARQRGGGEGTLDALFAQSLVDYLTLVGNRGRHLSKVRLTDHDTRKMIQRLPDAAQRMHARRFQTFMNSVTPHGSTAYEVLGRVDERLRSRSPAIPRAPAQEAANGELAAAVHLLKTQRLGDRTDIVTFFKPFILDMALRDKVRLGGGGTLGVGLPALPYGPQSQVVSPLLVAETSRSEEAFAQLFMPVLGIEMMFGKVRIKANEATVGVVAGPSLGTVVALQGTATVRATRQHAKTDATLMRFFRKRHEEEAMRMKMLNALDSLVRWDMIEPGRGRAYSGPLEAVFARNPEVSVSQVDAVADTTTIRTAVSARIPSVKHVDPHSGGIAQTFRVEPSLSAEAQRTRERRDERGGHVNVYAAVGDTAQRRASVGLSVAGAPLSYLPPDGPHHAHHTGAQRETLGLQLGITRDIAWDMEKHEISPFLLDGKQDGDLDRHYSTPTDMLKEISANREQWLMRCVETLEPDEKGNTDTPDNRMRAGVLLDEFEREIGRLGQNSNYCLYNVNYSMRGAASEWIDGYRGLAQLARKRGDMEAERKAHEAIDEILVSRGTWRPLMLIVRERAKDSVTLGWRNVLRWERMANVDGQRTAAQFPPP
ncbi:hypothetical protein J2797_005894 [Paraburkholderia terricola]|uniref:hypothetical protein n=1 Tax=Paraburkholderia terricola TaxID=169427 RepID=UPI0028675DC3|nr:hypothetical protein [Paraburkholderia terricola]MDR6495969.1 hypothetical protein [Paraburkholderia terricola]